MSNYRSYPLVERNPVTHKAHRREVFWQITAPLVIGVVILLVLAVLASLGASNDVGRWADISLVWLILPAMVVASIFLILLGALAYGVIWLVRKLPVFASRVQHLFTSAGEQVGKLSDAMVEPVLRLQGFAASMRALRRK